MEFRGNFMMSLLVESVYLLAKALYVLVVFRTDLHVDGIPPEVASIYRHAYGGDRNLCRPVFTNFMKIPEYVKDGSLDLMLTKPVSLQFMASLRYVDLAADPGYSGWVRHDRHRLACDGYSADVPATRGVCPVAARLCCHHLLPDDYPGVAFILVRPDGLCVGDRSFRLGRQQFPYGYIPGLGPADRDFCYSSIPYYQFRTDVSAWAD